MSSTARPYPAGTPLVSGSGSLLLKPKGGLEVISRIAVDVLERAEPQVGPVRDLNAV